MVRSETSHDLDDILGCRKCRHFVSYPTSSLPDETLGLEPPIFFAPSPTLSSIDIKLGELLKQLQPNENGKDFRGIGNESWYGEIEADDERRWIIRKPSTIWCAIHRLNVGVA